jgi:hypothetical protein
MDPHSHVRRAADVVSARTSTAPTRHQQPAGDSGGDQHSAADPYQPFADAEQDAIEVKDPEPDITHDDLR